MQGFEADEKGLFTFYRELAEMEEQIKEQEKRTQTQLSIENSELAIKNIIQI